MFSKRLMEHFLHPRNMGILENPDGLGIAGNPMCGDMTEIFIKVKEGRLEDIKFRTFGCGATIAAGSMITELLKKKTIEEALDLCNSTLKEVSSEFPSKKDSCVLQIKEALKAAVNDYLMNLKKAA